MLTSLLRNLAIAWGREAEADSRVCIKNKVIEICLYVRATGPVERSSVGEHESLRS